MSFFQNTCKPKGLGGSLMVNMMNIGHSPMAEWGLKHIKINKNDISLDVGCGGGANIKKLLEKSPRVKFLALIIQRLVLENQKKLIKFAVERKHCEILQGNVQELPFANETFDLATAFETIYFWSDIDQSFSQIYRVLKKGGIFMVCNESNGENDKDKKWTEIIKGMKIYTSKEIKYSLEKAGFTHIETNKNAKGWLCVVARK